jgi:exonuclease III/cell envelope opacity-associated protein A
MEEMREVQWDVLGVAETHRKEKEEEYELPGGHLYLGSGGTTKYRGVALVLNKKRKGSLKKWTAVCDRLGHADLCCGGRPVKVIVVYMPTTGHREDEVDQMYEKLSKVVEEAKARGAAIIGLGDFNAVIGRRGEENEATWHGGHALQVARNPRGCKLAAWVQAMELRIQNTAFYKESAKLITHVRGSSERTIDYMLTNKRDWLQVLNTEVATNLPLVSDHRPLRMEVRLKKTEEGKRKKWPKKRETFKGWQPSCAEDFKWWVDFLWEENRTMGELQKSIAEAGWICWRKAAAEERPREEEGEMKALRETRRAAHRAGRRNEVRELSKRIQKEGAKAARRVRRTKLHDLVEQGKSTKRHEEQQERKKSKFLKVDGRQLRNEEMSNAFAEDLKARFSSRGDREQTRVRGGEDLPELTSADVKSALMSMKINKAADREGIIMELYREGGERVWADLATIFNRVLQGADAEELWAVTELVMLHKGGLENGLPGFRPIAILPITYKIFATCILQKVNPLFEKATDQEQTGSRKDFSTLDNLVLMQRVLEHAEDFGNEGQLAILDFHSAFDELYFEEIWEVFRNENFPENAIAALEKIYGSQKGLVRGQTGHMFDICRGVRQGDPLSSRIFGLIISKLFAKLAARWKEKGWGVFLATEFITHGCYADDAFILAASKQQLTDMLQEVITEAAKFGLRLNWKKTKAMDMQGTRRTPVNFLVDGQTCVLNFENDFILLGRYFEKGGGGAQALKFRIQKAWGAFWKNKEVLLDQTLSFRKRLTRLTQTVGSALLYAVESLELNRAQLLMIRTTRRQMMRRMSGRKWQGAQEEERETDEEEQDENADESQEYGRWISNLTRELEAVVEEGKAGTRWEDEALRRKYAWTGHILRRGQERRTARVVAAEEDVLKRARRGFPTKRWDDSFKRVLGDNWHGEAQDRAQWQFWTAVAIEGALELI